MREHPEIETVLVGDGWPIYAKESKMVTVDDIDDEMLFRDEEAENVKEAVERVVRLRVDLAGIMLRTSDPTDVYLEDVNFAGTRLRNTQLTAARLASDLRSAEFTDTVLRGSNLRTVELENIREDLWAVLSVVAAAWGIVLTPAFGAVLMSVSTVIVAINARLLGKVAPAPEAKGVARAAHGAAQRAA